MSHPAAGKLADPAWRQERARKAANACTGIDYHVRAIVARAGKLTPEQIEVLRSLLPEPADAGDQT
jgi:hypothetical protein